MKYVSNKSTNAMKSVLTVLVLGVVLLISVSAIKSKMSVHPVSQMLCEMPWLR